MTFPIDSVEVVLAGAVISVGAYVQGSVGFGLALVATALLVQINPVLVPGPLILSGSLLNVLMSRRNWEVIDVSELKYPIIGLIPGSIAGAWVLTTIPPRALAISLGSLVLIAVAIIASGIHPRITTSNLLGAGVLSGFMGTTASIGGPPIAMIYHRASAPQLRGKLAGFFFISACISLISLFFAGKFGVAEILVTLPLFVGVLLGYSISLLTAKKIDRFPMRPVVLVFSAAAGLAVIIGNLV
ncbi:MAG: sulfite exporter TauE/SafE family protein [bacterium]|nr:sulfite exporter TauE/SafE family protein [bacterium]